MRSFIAALVLAQCLLLAHVALAAGAEAPSAAIPANPTDLPTYPHLSKATVMHTPRGAAKIYNAETHDAYAAVLAWYRMRLVGATESESGFVKDTLTFSLPKGRQVIVQGRPPITYISLSQNAD